MKNIKDIMKEMNSLSDQIAVSLSTEEDAVNQLETVTQTTPSCAMNAQTTCANVDSNSRNIPFCAAISLPGNFSPIFNSASPRIIYDLSCLRTVVESCCCNGVPKWDIRVIGSISFIVNVDIRSTGNCVVPSNTTLAVSGSNSVCVNRVICNKCSYEDAIITRSNIRFDCSNVIVQNLAASQDNCAIKVTGNFRLPECP